MVRINLAVRFFLFKVTKYKWRMKEMKDNQTENLTQNKNKKENWIDDLIERQEHDLEEEEEILSTVPNRIKHKYLEEDG